MKRRYFLSIALVLSGISACGLNTTSDHVQPQPPEPTPPYPKPVIEDDYLGSILFAAHDDKFFIHKEPLSLSKRSEPDQDNVFVISKAQKNSYSEAWKLDAPSKSFKNVSIDTADKYPILFSSSYYDSNKGLLYVCGFELKLLHEVGVLVLKKNESGAFNWIKFINIPMLFMDQFQCQSLTVEQNYLFVIRRVPLSIDKSGQVFRDDESPAVFAAKIGEDPTQMSDSMTPIIKFSDLRKRPPLEPLIGEIHNMDIEKPYKDNGNTIRIFVGSHLLSLNGENNPALSSQDPSTTNPPVRESNYTGGIISDITLVESKDPSNLLAISTVKTLYTRASPSSDPRDWFHSMLSYKENEFVLLLKAGLFKETFDDSGSLLQLVRLNKEKFTEGYRMLGGYGPDKFGKTKNPTIWILPRKPKNEFYEFREYNLGSE